MTKVHNLETLGGIIDAVLDEDFTLVSFYEARCNLMEQFDLSLLKTEKYGLVLAIPESGAKIARLFKGTRWEDKWAQAMREAPPPILISDPALKYVTINGERRRCVVIALKPFKDGAK